MTKRLVAIAVIFLGASVAWLILGNTLLLRTDQSDSGQIERLTAQWGSSQTQLPPSVTGRVGKADAVVPLDGSNIKVDLQLEQRQKGLLWYNLYNVRFAARYTVRNLTDKRVLSLHFPFPSSEGTYSDLTCAIGGKPIGDAPAISQGYVPFDLAPGQQTTIEIGYRSRGMGSWQYRFGDGVRPVNNFDMTMTTDFAAIDFPAQTLLPVNEDDYQRGKKLRWTYGSIVTANGIGMAIPYPLQPGPLAQRITFWAPVALLFYLFVMLVVTTLRNVDLHPVNYFFLAAAFFAFHLLFAYLVDRIPLGVAFAICSVVSMFLTISYLRLVAGWRFAAVESALAQLVYLILFSWALFNEGWSGLSITIGIIITLFIIMQVTGRIRWSERFTQSG